MGYTAISDIIVPEVFSAYTQARSEVKSKLVRSGVVVRDPQLDAKLAGGGITFQMPSFNDLPRTDVENVSSDNSASSATPKSIGSFEAKAVRLSRNQVWGAADLAGALAGADPMAAISAKVGDYWSYRMQVALLAALSGVFKNNTDADAADMTKDVSAAGVFSDGVTNFTAEAAIDTLGTMGDSSEDLGIVWAHSYVVNRMKKNNLIDMRPDATNPDAAAVPFFLGRQVIEDDAMYTDGSGVFHTYFLGVGSCGWGNGTPKVPVETYRLPHAGDGAGVESLISRVEWAIQPYGFSFVAAASGGGPTNATTAGNLDHKDSWDRAVPERKMAKIARLITTEF